MEELLASQPQQKLSINRGQEIEGKVVLVTEKEIIVDLGTKSDGVIPLNEVKDKLPKIGDSVLAYVLEPENESGQVILTIQRASKTNDTSTNNLINKYTPDQIIKGVITKVTQFGAFVKLEEGVEGLIHSSKLGPEDNFESGQEISVMVDAVDLDKKRISLAPVITSTKGLIYK